MELTRKEQKFSQALETVEDLYSLGASELYPLFDRILYQIGELSRDSEIEKRAQEPRFNSVEKLFKKHVEELVRTYFDSIKETCQVNFVSNLEQSSIARVDLICELLPHVFNAGCLFNFQKNLFIEINNEEIVFKGKIQLSENLEDLRIDSYRLSRTFLDLGVLFTFESLESDSESLYDIVFKFSMPDEASRLFGMRLTDKKWLTFPSVIGNFQVETSRLKSIGNHRVYLIDENYQLKKLSHKDIDKFNMKSKVTALHFPFLFRPISLIISGESTMVEKATLFRQSSTGCAEENEKNNAPTWQHIDLIDLMKN